MKTFRLSMTALVLAMSLGTKAQTTLTTAVDFTVTDLHGGQHTLFDYLNAGKYVVVDFFAYWCGPCQATAPQLKTVYQQYGCNQGDVIFLALDGDGTVAQTTNFENTHVGAGGPPTVAAGGGADAAHTAYGITALPTYILIAPNKQIVNQDIWPMNATILDDLLEGYSLQHLECVSGTSVVENALQFELSPNPASSLLRINFHAENYNVNIYNVMGQEVLQQLALNGQQEISIASLPVGNYVVRINDGKNAGTQSLTIVR